ncbi:MAG: glycosyltransferase family 4 protein [Polyangiales bacterium]
MKRTGSRPRAIFLTTSDGFLLSHRRILALAFLREGFEVTVVASDTGRGPEIRSLGLGFVPWPVERGSVSPLSEAKAAAFVLKTYREIRPDFAHHSSIKPVLYGSAAAALCGGPGVINTMSGLGYALIERPDDPPRRRLLREVAYAGYRAALRRPNCHSVFQNPDQLEMFRSRGLIDPARTTLIRGAGVDTQRFAVSPLPDGVMIAALPARMLWDKGVGEFVEAARILKARGVPVRMALVGGTDTKNRAGIAEETLQQWVSEGVVEWWGHQTDMASLWTRVHLAVLPSYAEGLPLALAEAASSGRAVVTTDVPGCRETVIHGETGWLIEVRSAVAIADAVQDAVRRRGELTAMGLAGRALAERSLSQEQVIRETLAVARSLRVRWPER